MIINMVLNLLDKSISHFITFEAKSCEWETILHFIVLIKTNVFLGAEAVTIWEVKAGGSLEIRHLSYSDNSSLNAHTYNCMHTHTLSMGVSGCFSSSCFSGSTSLWGKTS